MGGSPPVAAPGIVVDVIVPDQGGTRENYARIVGANLVVINRPVTRHHARSMNATPQVADEEITDGYVVDIFVVSSERGVKVVGGRPTGSVQNSAVLADEGIPGPRDDGDAHVMDAGSQTECGPSCIGAHSGRAEGARPDVDGPHRTRDRRLRPDTGRN